MMNLEDILNQGIALQSEGRYEEALQAYDSILSYNPDHSDALNFSGIIAFRTGDQDKAVRLIKKALARSPHNSGYLNSLGNALQASGDPTAALHAYQKGLSLAPDDLDLLYNISRLYKAIGENSKALNCLQKVLQINPEDDWAWNVLGNLQRNIGELEEATTSFKRAIELNPQPSEAFSNLANTYRDKGRYTDALENYRKAIEREPDNPEIHSNMSVALKEIGRSSEAVASCQKALRLDPGNAGAFCNLGSAYRERGQVTDALDCYRECLNIVPDHSSTHSNLLFCANNDPDYDQARLFSMTRNWWQKHGTGFDINDRFSNPPDQNRRLKVGYVSPDFKRHSVSYFFKPLLSTHNRDEVEVFCYSNVICPDRVTRDLRDLSDHWRDIVGFSDQRVFDQVVNDGIDILVDLAGHTAGNRLLVFAMQPAPVQVTWLGYPNTTGIPPIQYRLTDSVSDPQGGADRYHTEELIRLPHGFLCYQPPKDCPRVTPTPALASGQITFASFNSTAKISRDVIQVWAEVLRAVPGAKLLLKSRSLGDMSVRSRYLEMFVRLGVSPNQLEMMPFVRSPSGHMSIYNRVDIALDTFPYNGTTTTCEALWMGVPVVTLRGKRHAARVGASLLTHIDCPELIADSAQSYVQIVTELVSDLNALNEVRQTMRARLQTSDLCDAVGFAGDLEQAYRGLWKRWCAQGTEKGRPAMLKSATGTRGARSEDPQALYPRGLALMEAGDLKQAREIFERTIALDSGHVDAYCNIGLIRQRQERLSEAIEAYQIAVKLDPENPDAFYNMGNCFRSLHQPDNALYNYRKALQLNPSFAQAHNNMGLVLKNTGRLEDAIHSINRAIDLDPNAAAYHQNLGLTLQKKGLHRQAIDSFEAALKLLPDSPVICYNLGAAFEYIGEYEQASRQLTRAIALDPDFGKAYHNYGVVLGKMGRFDEAAESYRQAIRVKPDRAESWNGLGNELNNLGRAGEAVDCYKRAIQLQSDYAGAYTNLGTAYYESRQLDQAEKYHRQALELDAGLVEAEFNLGLVYLLRGDLEKGWPGYEKRFNKSDWAANYPFRLDRPKWDGRPFKGQRLLIHDEQGLGDTLQFVRYLEMVKPLGGQVLLETRRPFLGLLQDIRGVDQLVERSSDGKPAVDFDLHCPLLNLPMIFSTGLDSIPARIPYIKADQEKAKEWSRRLEAQVFKVGIVWSGNPTHFRGLNRSAPLEHFEGLLSTPGVRFYGFQKGEAAREIVKYADTGWIENLGEDFADFSDTAAAMAHMDLVISIDTSVAHLAGALGKPIWVLLAYAADWRWLIARSDSPWYPTTRLFRQERKNDWAGVVDEVKEALDEMLA